MSTHSNISIKTDKGYETIYCHNDGYPSYMYPMLRDYYSSWERAIALVSFGDASFIAKRIMPSKGSNHHFDHPEEDVCIFYHRDRGEPWEDNAPTAQPSKQEAVRCYYSYIFEDGEWHIYINGNEVDDYESFE